MFVNVLFFYGISIGTSFLFVLIEGYIFNSITLKYSLLNILKYTQPG